MSTIIDKTFLIHIGIELVVVGGLSFWLNRKISVVDAKYTALLEIISKQQSIIDTHDRILRAIVEEANRGAPRGMVSTPPTQPSIPVITQSQPRASSSTENVMVSPPSSTQIIIDSDEPDETAIDSLLDKELNSLKEKDVTTPTSGDYLEIETITSKDLKEKPVKTSGKKKSPNGGTQ
jgi:hypothetical protein